MASTLLSATEQAQFSKWSADIMLRVVDATPCYHDNDIAIDRGADAPTDGHVIDGLLRGAAELGFSVSFAAPDGGWDSDQTDGQTHHGALIGKPNAIYIREGMSSGATWRVLTHELCHAQRGPINIMNAIAFLLNKSGRKPSDFTAKEAEDFMEAQVPAATELIKQREELIVEYATGLVTLALGGDPSRAAQYLARYRATPTTLLAVLTESVICARRVLGWLGAPIAQELSHAA